MFFLRELIAGNDDGVLEDDRACPPRDVECVRHNFVAPELLAVEIEPRDHRGAERHVDAFAVAGRRRRSVAAAQVRQLPWARRDGDVPELAAIVTMEAEHVVFGIFLLGDALGPVRHGDDDAFAADDGARLILIAAHLVGGEEPGLPADIILALAAPGEWQASLVAQAHGGRAAPAGPALAGKRRQAGQGHGADHHHARNVCHNGDPGVVWRRVGNHTPRYFRHASRIAFVAVAPTRVTPMARTASKRSKSRTPPAALTWTRGGEQRRMSRKSSSVAPVLP